MSVFNNLLSFFGSQLQLIDFAVGSRIYQMQIGAIHVRTCGSRLHIRIGHLWVARREMGDTKWERVKSGNIPAFRVEWVRIPPPDSSGRITIGSEFDGYIIRLLPDGDPENLSPETVKQLPDAGTPQEAQT